MRELTEEKTDQLVILFSYVPMLVYIGVAILLSIIAFLSLIDSVYSVISIISSNNPSEGIINVVYSILFTVIIIELFETVSVYIKTKKVPVRALIIVALTAVIRHLIVMSVSDAPIMEYIGVSIVMAVLISGIYLLKEDIHNADIRI
jgi:uncharacterized membrane protein (DUF373 family)